MTTQKSKPWELKLSPAHLVIVLGLITGSMAGAFYLGFSSGQHVGYESALHATLSNMARMPIPADETDSASNEEVTSEVYAKLINPAEKDEPAPRKDGKAGKDQDMPELGAIASTESLPILPDSVTSSSAPAKNGFDGGKASAASTGSTETVGSLMHRSAASEAAAVKEPPKAEQSSSAVQHAASSPAKEPEVETPKVAAVEHAASSVRSEPAHDEKVAKEPVKAVEPPPVKKEPATSTIVRSNIPSGWYVQVAAPRQIEEANEIASALKKAKIPVMIEAAQVRGEDYFRVVAGPQPQRAGAEKILAQIKGKTSVKGDPFVRAVK